jgi:hypothetical protein
VILSYRVILLPVFILLLLGFCLWTVISVDENGWAQVARVQLTGAVRTIRLLPGTAVKFAATAPTLLGCMIQDYRKVELRTQPNFVFLWLSRFTVFLGYAAFIQYIKLYIDSNLDWQGWLIGLGFSAEGVVGSESAATAAFGTIVGFFIIGGLFGSRAAGRLADRFGKKAVIGGGMVIAALADIPLVMTSNVWLAICCGVVIGMGWGAFISADWAFACTLMPKQKAGSYMGIWDISTLLPQVISPVLAGLLYQVVYAVYAGGAGFTFTLSTTGIPAENPAVAALGFKYVITSLLVYFAIGLWVLRAPAQPGGGAVPAPAGAALPVARRGRFACKVGLPFLPEVVLAHAAVEVVPGQRLIRRPLAKHVLTEVDAVLGQQPLPDAVVEVIAEQRLAGLHRGLDQVGQFASAAAQQRLDCRLAAVVPAQLHRPAESAQRVAQPLLLRGGQLRILERLPLQRGVGLGHQHAQTDAQLRFPIAALPRRLEDRLDGRRDRVHRVQRLAGEPAHEVQLEFVPTRRE